jgi:hypothetical protein
MFNKRKYLKLLFYKMDHTQLNLFNKKILYKVIKVSLNKKISLLEILLLKILSLEVFLQEISVNYYIKSVNHHLSINMLAQF